MDFNELIKKIDEAIADFDPQKEFKEELTQFLLTKNRRQVLADEIQEFLKKKGR